MQCSSVGYSNCQWSYEHDPKADSLHKVAHYLSLQSIAAGTAPSSGVGVPPQERVPGSGRPQNGTRQPCVQSSDNIHIQLEPLQSMDSYANKLMSPGMEVAIYSGRCPLAPLAAQEPSRFLQQQVSDAQHPRNGKR